MYTAQSVMNTSAALLNDAALTNFTYAVQMVYLNVALAELRQLYQENNVPLTNKRSAAITLTAGMTDIGGLTGPALPTDLIEIQGLYERLAGTNDSYLEVGRREFLPQLVQVTSGLMYWAWEGQAIKFIGANTNRQVRIDYIAEAVPKVEFKEQQIHIINGEIFLSFRTAALCALFIGENKERSDELNTYAGLAIERLLNISTKGRQSILTRRRPFMAGWKSRSIGG